MNIELRLLQLADGPRLAMLADNPRLAEQMRDAFPHPYTQMDAINFIEQVASNPRNLVRAITYQGELCGCIGLHGQSDVYQKSAELGYWVGQDYWGQGIASAAVGLILDLGWKTLDLHRIYAGVFSTNPASMRVLEKNGFKKEGLAHNAIYKNGAFYDEHRYAIL